MMGTATKGGKGGGVDVWELISTSLKGMLPESGALQQNGIYTG